jgi:regulator of sigma E protease
MKIIVAVLILGIIVIIHELGHFLLAKANGVTVVEFSVGMGPRIASFERKGTKYSLKLLPFGGSCIMLGEDETVDDEGSFTKKGVWARFSVIFAGAFFNFILAFVLALIILGDVGVDRPYVTTIKQNGSAQEAGLEKGDLITAINHTKIHMSREIQYHFLFYPISEKEITITYQRDGVTYHTSITPQWRDIYMLGCGYTPNEKPAVLETVDEGYPLAKAGVQVGDTIVEINGKKINSSQEMADYLTLNPISDAPVTIKYMRDGNISQVTVNPVLVQSGYDLGFGYNQYREKISALQTIQYSFYELKHNIVITIKSFAHLIIGKISVNEVSGPVGVVNIVGDIVSESQNYGIHTTLLSLAQFCVLLSANLGVVNLLPLPALDGGRLVFLVIEAIRRKPVPKEKEAMVHFVGMAVLMLLMVLVLFNDIRKIIL